MVKITALPPMASPDGADPAPIVDDSAATTKKITLTQVKTWLITQLAWITGGMLVSGTIKNTQIDYTTAGKIWWEELGRTTLASAGDTITVSGLPARKYLKVILQARPTGGTINSNTTFNADTAANYARALSNGGIYSTSASLSNLNWNNTSAQNIYLELRIFNVSTIEKGVRGSITEMNTAGAANAPIALYGSGKWANTSADISSITFTNTGTGDYAIGSEAIVKGHP